MSMSVLIAGIGNIFHGDDAFGVAVAHKLAAVRLPDNVRAVDFGIRGIDLAFAVLDGYDVIILVDATEQGREPGTLYTIEPDLGELPEAASDGTFTNSHGLDPAKVLVLAKSMGAKLHKILLIGCEPLALGDEGDGRIGLSQVVEAAVDRAIEMICSLVQDFTKDEEISLYTGGLLNESA